MALPEWIEKLRRENIADPWLVSLRQQIKAGTTHIEYKVKDGIIFFQNRFCISPTSDLRNLIMEELHASNVRGHSGVFHTLTRIRLWFFWSGMAKDVKEFTRSCRVCQQVKIPTTKPSGLLQPLSIPFSYLGGFRNGLCNRIAGGTRQIGHRGRSRSLDIILLLRRTISRVHSCIGGRILRNSDCPSTWYAYKTITSDRDKNFLSRFWKELFTRSGTTLKMSSAYHPETDDQTEITNKMVEHYLQTTMHRNP